MMTLTEASKAVNISKSALLKAIKSGRMSAVRDDRTGNFSVDPAELFRAYPPSSTPDKPQEPDNQVYEIRISSLEQRVSDLTNERDRVWNLLQSETNERQRLLSLLSHDSKKDTPKTALWVSIAVLGASLLGIAAYLFTRHPSS